MHPAGRVAIAESKRRGLCEVMADVDALVMPNDLIAGLEAHPLAAEQFAQFSTALSNIAFTTKTYHDSVGSEPS